MKVIKINEYINNHGMKLIEKTLLTIIVIATLTAIWQEIAVIIEVGRATLGDLLLFFIYLEIISMAAAYNKSGRVPVRVPIYIAIVAISRVLILDMKDMSEIRIATLSISAFVLAGTVVIIRWGQIRLPYSADSTGSRNKHEEDEELDDMHFEPEVPAKTRKHAKKHRAK